MKEGRKRRKEEKEEKEGSSLRGNFFCSLLSNIKRSENISIENLIQVLTTF
tara:strand:- start:123 stop:275 length:153 start_codon:yes stop_codon:yes gene_type:complete